MELAACTPVTAQTAGAQPAPLRNGPCMGGRDNAAAAAGKLNATATETTMTFKFTAGKVVETGDAYDERVTGTQFNVTGDAWGHVVFHVAWKEGRGRRQVNVRVQAETILALADAIRCCPNHINEDPARKKGPEYPPRWIGHALWHLQHPTAVRPCLEHGTEIIDVDHALTAGTRESFTAQTEPAPREALRLTEPPPCPGRQHPRHTGAVCDGSCCTACGGPIDEKEACRCGDTPRHVQ